MFGLLRDAIEGAADLVGTVAGVAIAPIAYALDVSESAVRRAVKAGCKTQREVRGFLDKE